MEDSFHIAHKAAGTNFRASAEEQINICLQKWECIAKVFRKLYVKYKSNAIYSYGDITILNNLNQKLDRRMDGKVNH